VQWLQRLRRFPRRDCFHEVEFSEKVDVDSLVQSHWKFDVDLADFLRLFVETSREEKKLAMTKTESAAAFGYTAFA
jgi:hypothetical protein